MEWCSLIPFLGYGLLPVAKLIVRFTGAKTTDKWFKVVRTIARSITPDETDCKDRRHGTT
jgi:hypothetical protein